MKIIKYKNKISFSTNDRSDSFNNITKHHLYKDWRNIISYFKRRGFNFKTQQYHIDNDWAKPFNKVGFKNNGVVIVLSLNSSEFDVDFGFKSNLWDSENSFWSDWHDKFTALSYLENKSIELEVKKLLNKYNHLKLKERNTNLKGEDYIIQKELENPHIHGGAKSLEDVKTYVDSNFSSYNHLDADKKKIVCGETKYYYDYDKRLKKGIVYHNINNMWWVLSGGDNKNIACFNLFDFNGQPKRKVLTKEEKINRLEKELRLREKQKEYHKCIVINKQIEKLKGQENTYRVWSIKHGCWWRSNDSGYTSDERQAGIYLESNILANQNYYNDGRINKAVLI